MDNFNPLRDAIPVGEIRRALVIKLRHHGDVLVSSPVCSVLKVHAPQAEIDALVYADTAEMVTLHPAVAQVHTIDRKWKQLGVLGQARAELALYSALDWPTTPSFFHCRSMVCTCEIAGCRVSISAVSA